MSDLHDPHVLPLWQAIKERLIETGDLTKIRTVRVELSTAGLARLNGWIAHSRATRLTARNGWVRVPLDRLLTALGPSADLTTVLRDTVGLPDVLQPHRRLAALKTDFWSSTQARLPKAPILVQHLRSGGLSDTSIEQRGRLVDALARAHDLIPLQQPIALPRLSFCCVSDPHYFDFSHPGQGAKLVMLAAEILGEQPLTARSPLERFALLARCGIYPDRISTTVIVLNLDAVGDGPIDDTLRQARATPRPVHLSLYDLTMHPPRISDAERVLVVENPSVLEEAIIRRYRGALACTSGALSAVDHQFLQTLNNDGVPIRYSGDHDAAGRLIAQAVRTRYGADIVEVPSAPDAGHEDTVIYQEDHRYLELLLGTNLYDQETTTP